jgi:hypothetical protein
MYRSGAPPTDACDAKQSRRGLSRSTRIFIALAPDISSPNHRTSLAMIARGTASTRIGAKCLPAQREHPECGSWTPHRDVNCAEAAPCVDGRPHLAKRGLERHEDVIDRRPDRGVEIRSLLFLRPQQKPRSADSGTEIASSALNRAWPSPKSPSALPQHSHAARGPPLEVTKTRRPSEAQPPLHRADRPERSIGSIAATILEHPRVSRNLIMNAIKTQHFQ